ncbi:hypothetical protein ACH435_15845 [Streptomyces purpureus]|uniref:hypothetical protein n=1 Tax=Streptomyces purpureus TaxID=1951 RepID=UPI001E51D0C7|nr:hypothetical protein [Streptomyces purpureus]
MPRPTSPAPSTPPRRAPGEAAPAAPPTAPAPSTPPRPTHPGPLPPEVPPQAPVETTTRLRPVPAYEPPSPYDAPSRPPAASGRKRRPGVTAAAVVCVVLGLGLLAGAATGSWLTGDSAAGPARPAGYGEARTLWHSVPVDRLFPPTLKGDGAGPGGADRVWTRIAVAPDGPCAGALDPLLVKTLQPVGCLRVLRATYTDATSSHVTTVGMVFTEAEPDAMRALNTRFAESGLQERADLMPRTLPAPGTVAAGFGDRQRASWWVRVLTDVPVVVYSVSGFADARPVTDPQPADEAMAAGQTTAPAQSGLGHEAKGITDRIERGLRKTVATATKDPQ